MEKEKMRGLTKAVCWLLIACNAVSLGFTLYFAITYRQGAAANALGILLVGTLLADAFYCMFGKKRLDFYWLVSYIVGILGCLASAYLTVLPLFRGSRGYGGAVCLALLLSGAIARFAVQLSGRAEKPARVPNLLRNMQVVLCVLGALVLIFFAVLAQGSLFGFRNGQFEMTFNALLFYLALLTWGILCLIAQILRSLPRPERGAAIWGRRAYAGFCLLLGCFSLVGLGMPMLLTGRNIEDARTQYAQAFGTEYLDYKTDSMQQVEFSVPSFFMGIPTTGYDTQKDVCYYTGTGADEGIELRYDVHYPTGSYDTKRPVLIRMHGNGGNKGLGNFPQPNKYFASRGYVVFDLQYGNWGEFSNPTEREFDKNINDYLAYLRDFFQYAKANDNHNADWDSVFISGNSLGGGVADAFALSWNLGDPVYEALGITVKGLLPIYPANWEDTQEEGKLWNALPLVTKDSVPCLMFMGTHDTGVDAEIAQTLPQAYRDAGNPKCAAVLLRNAGHCGDSLFCGNYMQTYLYFMERFMAQYA